MIENKILRFVRVNQQEAKLFQILSKGYDAKHWGYYFLIVTEIKPQGNKIVSMINLTKEEFDKYRLNEIYEALYTFDIKEKEESLLQEIKEFEKQIAEKQFPCLQ